MVCTVAIGAAGGGGARGYAEYVLRAALDIDGEKRAAYYTVDGPEHGIRLRPDTAASLAAALHIELGRPLRMDELTHLMGLRTADGEEISGRKKHTARQSVASVFGLSEDRLPTAEEVRNVLAGMRVDGAEPRGEHGNQPPLPKKRVVSAVRAFKRAIGVPVTRDATDEEVQRIVDGRFDVKDYQKRIGATTPATGYADFTFSSGKEVGIAYALAPTEAERDFILGCVIEAADDAMRFVADFSELGAVRRGGGGAIREPAEVTWASAVHTTARPVIDLVRKDAEGRKYSAPVTVPTAKADVNLHVHSLMFSAALSADGHVGSVPFGDVTPKVYGAVFHAALATRLRARGVDVRLGPNGEAQIAGIPAAYRRFASRRREQSGEAAREWAKERNLDWDALTPEQQADEIDKAVEEQRRPKDKSRRRGDEAAVEIEQWQADAAAFGYTHRSVLRPDEPLPEMPEAARIRAAREGSMHLLDAAFQKDAVLPEAQIREIAARGLIVSGLGKNPAEDIEALVQTYKEQGILVAGRRTELVWGVEYGADNRPKTVVSTKHNQNQEHELVALVRELAADATDALTPQQINEAADRVLARNLSIDREGAQWRAQVAMAHRLGEGPRVALGVGVAGSGKTMSTAAILAEAWREQGKTSIGMTVPWRAKEPLLEAKLDNAMAIAAFITRVQSGALVIDCNTRIIADEVSMVGVPQQLDLLRLVKKYGARLVEIGDPKQTASVETPSIELMANAIGDENIPKLLTTIRQKTQRGKEIATMWRNGEAAEALSAMQVDGDLAIVAGGAEATIKATAAEWRGMSRANAEDPDYSLVVITPRNARVLDIGRAIRDARREAGEIGLEDTIVRARIGPAVTEVVDLPLSVGDKVRPFQRLYDADTPGRKKFIASNGDVVEIRQILPDGLLIRNADGVQGRITWSQLKPWRAPASDPVVLTYGYVSSVHAAQSLTRTEALWSVLDGSAAIMGNEAYVALSRHTTRARMIVSDAAEREQIQGRKMLGLREETPTQEDVVRNIAENLSRFRKRRLASEMHRQDRPDMARRPAAERQAHGRRQKAASAWRPPGSCWRDRQTRQPPRDPRIAQRRNNRGARVWAPVITAAGHRARDDARAARESERLAREEQATIRALVMWQRAKPISGSSNAYLRRKAVSAHGIRQDTRGRLVVPLRDTGGTIRNAQTIRSDGEKRFVKDGRKVGLFAQLGEIEAGRPVLIAEGYATAASLHEVTGLTVVVAFDAGNLEPVARAIRATHPELALVIAADNDHHLPRTDAPLPNTGREKAEAAARAVGGVVILPSFGAIEQAPLVAGTSPPTDWNDYAAVNGTGSCGGPCRSNCWRTGSSCLHPPG